MLKGKKSQYDPPNPSRSSVGPGGQQDQERGVVLQDQQPSITFRSGSSQVPQGLSITPPTHPGGTGGQQDQGHGVVLHDHGEVYQQPIFEEVSLYFLGGDPIQYFGLDPIDPRSSCEPNQ